ncbi:cobyrinate a,c-diamide synthase [Gloeobacter morelensis]|uniref:Cobyrinate a,c-diamide synthase n=1 Tax=Gloeobacter morelensis MG652769 TaxID=2781736 RepID=A0ABY3PJB4_9CYAN|nr:cobyrinate a,c-diamide synthase [Gloeobacter morelensis]UFP93752.1 cobyrinate a,c-diamide synthase [Gloeobacter morelensis MG652769]
MAVIIAAPASGTGKTTITLAVLAYLKAHGLRVRSFKVGPDYIDPMFHAAVTGQGCVNLDLFLTDEPFVRATYHHHCQAQQAAVIEGVMGLFDGRAGQGDFASTAHVARLLRLPVILVIDGAGAGFSVAATLYGFRRFDPRVRIAGVILNRVGSERHAQILAEAVRSQGLELLGTVYKDETIALPHRHLGLVPVEELSDFRRTQRQLAALAARSFDWQQLLPLVAIQPAAPALPRWEAEPLPPVRIAVARDRAFSFYYQDNLELLAALGAQLEAFSPLAGEWPDCRGYLLGGGFPELCAGELSEKNRFWEGLRGAVARGVPLYAECGGLMVLGEALRTAEGHSHPMAGILEASCWMGKRTVLGYRVATALHSSCVVEAGRQVRGHLFHRSRMEPQPGVPLWQLDDDGQEGWVRGNLHASYLHLHWGTQAWAARRFMRRCLAAALEGKSTPARF